MWRRGMQLLVPTAWVNGSRMEGNGGLEGPLGEDVLYAIFDHMMQAILQQVVLWGCQHHHEPRMGMAPNRCFQDNGFIIID